MLYRNIFSILIIFIFISYFSGIYLLSIIDFDYYHLFHSNNKYIDFSIGFLFCTIILFACLFYISKQDNKNLFILISFLGFIKIFFIFNFSTLVDSFFFLDKDGYFINALRLEYKEEYDDTFFSKFHSGTDTMHMILNKILIFIPKSLYAVKSVNAILTLSSTILLGKLLRKYTNSNHYIAFLIIINLLPSFNVFGTAVSKDSFIIFFVSLFFYRASKFNNFKMILELLFYCLVIYFIRKWISAICLFSLVFIIRYHLNLSKLYFFCLIVFITIIIYFLLIRYYSPGLGDLSRLIYQFRLSFIGGGSSFEPLSIETLNDILLIPLLSFKTLFIPLIHFENLFLFFFSLENLFLLHFSVLIFIRLIFTKNIMYKFNSGFLIPLFIYVWGWLILYSPIIGNYGALIRYKITIVPIFIVFLMLLRYSVLNNKKHFF